jgi:hypothetical protein
MKEPSLCSIILEGEKWLTRSPNKLTYDRLTGSIALRLAYGELTPEDTHRLAELGDELARILSTASNPRRWLVNSFPARKLL